MKPKVAARAVSTVPSYSFDPGFGKAVALRLAGARPGAVACDSKGLVYVTEYRCQRIRVFDGSGNLVRTIPIPEAGSMYAMDLSVDASGNCVLYASQYPTFRIFIYGPDGTFKRFFDVPNHTIGIGLDAAGDIYGVWDYNVGGRLYKWSQTGTQLHSWTLSGGTFVRDVAISPTGDALITDEGGSQLNFLLRYRPDMTTNYLSPLQVTYQAGVYARSVVVDNLGVVYTADRGVAHAIHRFYAASGDIGAANLVRPWSVAVDPGGNVYVVDDSTWRVERFAISPPRGSEANPYPVDESTDSGLAEASTRTTNGRVVVFISGFRNKTSGATSQFFTDWDDGTWAEIIRGLGRTATIVKVPSYPGGRRGQNNVVDSIGSIAAGRSSMNNYLSGLPVVRNRDLALVGYSMGGLLARAFIDDSPGALAENTVGVLQIGTPNLGASMARLGAAFSTACADMTPDNMALWDARHANTADIPFHQIGGNHYSGNSDGAVGTGSLAGSTQFRENVVASHLFDAVHNKTLAHLDHDINVIHSVRSQGMGTWTHRRILSDVLEWARTGEFPAGRSVARMVSADACGNRADASANNSGPTLTVVKTLNLGSGETSSSKISLDTTVVVVSVSPSSAVPSLSDPEGRPVPLALDTADELSVTFVGERLSPGQYRFSITNTSETPERITVEVLGFGGPHLTATASPAAAAAGTSITVVAGVEPGPLSASEYWCEIEGENPIRMSDDGASPDEVALDGVFSAAVPPARTPGIRAVRVSACGFGSGSIALQRTELVYLAATDQDVRLDGGVLRPVVDVPPKLSGLALDVRLHPLTSSDTSVSVYADLYDENGELIAQPRAFVNLPPGEDTTVTLIADPYILHDNLTGPSRIFAKHVEVHALTDEVDVPVDEASDVATSEVYAPDDFAVRRCDLHTLGANPRQECTATLQGTAMSTETTVTGVDVSFDGGSVWFAALASDGAFDSLSETFTVSVVLPEGCWQVWARPRDGAGTAWDQADWGDHSITIDRHAPLTVSSVATASGVATVSLEASDSLSGIASTTYRVDGGPELPYEVSFEITTPGDHAVSFWSVDNAGNTETSQTITLTVPADTTPPETTCDLPQGWVDSSFRVTLSATDSGSGVAYTRYRVGEGELATYTAPFALEGEGQHAISFFSADTAGNVEPARTATVAVDASAPRTSSDVPSSWCSDTVTVTLAATDAYSGVARTVVRVGDAPPFDYDGPFAVTSEGETNIEFSSIDRVGNVEATQTATVRIDTAPPETTCDLPQGWVDSDFRVMLSATDSGSDIAYTRYRVGEGEYVTYTAPFALDGEGQKTVTFFSVDVAGNVEPARTVTIAVDASAPRTSSDAPSSWCSGTVTVTLAATDAYSGVARTVVRVGDTVPFDYDGPFAVTGEGVTNIDFSSIDRVGNAEATQAVTVRIDRTAPVTVCDAKPLYRECATITLSASDSLSGVAETEYRLDGWGWVPGAQAVVDAGGEHTLQFHSRDIVGNLEQTRSVSFTVLDRFEDTDPHIAYRGTWTASADPLASGGSVAITGETGAALAVSFTGTRIDLIATRDFTLGIAQVSIDGGEPALVDLYSPTTLRGRVVFSATGLSAGAHTLLMRHTGMRNSASAGSLVDLDAVEVAGTLTSASIPPLRVQESNRAFRFRGGWRKVYSESYSGGSARISDHRNARVDLEFYGTGVGLISARTPNGGVLEVSVDGGMPTLVDLRSDVAKYQVSVWGVSGLSEGWHVVEVDSPRSLSRPSREGTVLIDGADIR